MLVSVLSGLLVAGLFLPGVGAVWYAGRAARDGVAALPLSLDASSQSQRSQIRAANGEVLATFYAENRVYVGLDKIAPVMRQAIVAIEDARFYEHGALDVRGTLRAFLANLLTGRASQGGSTLTQQYVKLVQVSEASRRGDATAVRAVQESSYSRKIRELRYAIAVEKALSKDQILERYLNLAYFGDGAYGVEVAAEHYFGTTAAQLTLPQAALLAGLVQSPATLNPVADLRAAMGRRSMVLARMSDLGMVSTAQAAQARRSPYDPARVTVTPNGCAGSRYPFWCDYIVRTLAQTPSLGATPAERRQTLSRGGLTVTSTVDPATQDRVQREVSRVVGPTDPVIAVMDVVQPGTGRVLAMAQSRPVLGRNADAGETYWNYSAPPRLGGAQGFQAGSTFKTFTAAAALQQGVPLTRRYDARRSMDFSGAAFTSCAGRRTVTGGWRVTNSTGTSGDMDMYRAAQRSVNTYFVQLALDVGLCGVVTVADRLGVESSTPGAPISSYDDKPSFTLGTVEVSPLSMATAYATLAAGGVRCDPVVVDAITDADGTARPPVGASCRPVLEPDVAAATTALLSTVMTEGTGRRAATADARPQAGKTGTTTDNATVWFTGYTPQASGAAMISIDRQRGPFRTGSDARRRGLKGYTVPSTGVRLDGTGSADAGQQIWKPAMEGYLERQPPLQFPSAPLTLIGPGRR